MMALLVIGVVLLVIALLLRRSSVLPVAGKLVYSDADRRDIAETITSHRSRLTGRPDYVYEKSGFTTPVEVKKHRIRRNHPRGWDVEQLMTYGVLLEDMSRVDVKVSWTTAINGSPFPIRVKRAKQCWIG